MEREDSGRKVEPVRSPVSRRTLQIGVLVLVGVLGLVMIACWRVPEDDPTPHPQGTWQTPSSKAWDTLFSKWEKPDLAFLLSAQQLGYLQPCGCSKPQYGGLTRRYNFLQVLKSHGWPVAALDLGDVAQRTGIQANLKHSVSMKALNKMEYVAVGLGELEMNMPLIEALSHWTLNKPEPTVVASNLFDKEMGQMFNEMNVKPYRIFPKPQEKSKVRVGIIGAIGPSVRKQVRDPDIKLEDVPKVLPQMIKKVQAEKPNLMVLLYQGSLPEAKACARALPYFDLIVCVSAEEEPPSVPDPVITRNKTTLIVTLGHKGRYVGVMGVYATGKADKPFDLQYKLVPLGEEFDTPKGMEKVHPIMNIMEEYAQDVKKNNYLAHAAIRKELHPVQLEFPKSTYVGSKACKKCHESEYDIWLESPHSKAYQTLAESHNPSLRQYDSECIKCHVTGWDYKTGFMSETATPLLKNNGCENCHGPCSEHINLINNKKAQKRIRELINPYRFNPDETEAQRTRRINLIDQSCQKCHDIDNDVKWVIDKWWDGGKDKKPIVHSDDVMKAAKHGAPPLVPKGGRGN
jgi:hypothetical protein